MSKIGRRNGFVFAAIGSSCSALLAAFAISQKSFNLFCLSCLILGMGAAFNHQYRFAAAESVEKDKIPKACLLYTSPSPRDKTVSRMPSSA